MKSITPGMAKRLTISLVALAALGGCAVVPYNDGYYAQPGYVTGPVYAAPAPVYVTPSINLGFQYRSRGYYGGPRYYGHGYRGWR
ncbi:hypothetical protein [Herminiimonas sp. KBW02]|uniref:hypothetical protein n=1 Tax=Herminiimonas sp. KBW02 TaxID=2153363 RepID=UPI0018F54255|nr:hypothetical protein [Herminiimonas sp. KBW02]